MYRNMIGASSALVLLTLLAGPQAIAASHGGSKLCNVLLDGDGEPVLESDSDGIAHSNSRECEDEDEAAVENTGAETDTAAVAPEPVAKAEPLVVFFDVGEKTLDTEARAEVDAYVAELMTTPPKELTVVGFTDTSGPADLNAQLSEARANNVAAALIDNGVPSDLIARGAAGEDALAVTTPDGTREASNRRVTVTPTY